jgi:DNA repair exonuclease SbcCD ATPase subunit
MKQITVLACLFAAVTALPVQAQEKGARMYKCVDGAGKVYYSDKMNPDCAQGTELNSQGVTMKKKEVARPAQPAKADPADAAQKTSKENERRDRSLMATYTTEEEIDAARERTLAIPMQGTKTVENKLEKVRAQLDELKNQADAMAAQKKSLPAPLLEDVNANQKKISTLEADLAQRKAQMDSIRTRYESDKLRFRELKGVGQTGK